MKNLILLIVLATFFLSGCIMIGTTVNYITIKDGGQATITNDEDGNTTSANPVTDLKVIPND